jgi:hypothetical protein
MSALKNNLRPIGLRFSKQLEVTCPPAEGWLWISEAYHFRCIDSVSPFIVTTEMLFRLTSIAAVILLMVTCLKAEVIDDFSTYGSALNDGETGPQGAYQWIVNNNVPTHSSSSLDVNSSGLKLAGYFHEPHSGYAGVAEAVFTAGNVPSLVDFDLSFDVRERHDKLELDINVIGKSSAVFVFTGTGAAHLQFTNTEVREYLNGGFVQSRSYASLGWTATDLVRSFTLKGIHHDNGNSFTYVDNMAVTVPEPTAMTLLGCALLTGVGIRSRLRRRKRTASA